MNRPRTFCYVSRNGIPFPQIIYGDRKDRVGCEGLPIVATTERKLEAAEYHLGLNDLALKYPCPEMV
jgi:hypothetical protein